MSDAVLRVDAHHHVWRLDRGDYGWLTPALAPIYRDFGLDDVRPQLRAFGIDHTVLVQAAPTVAETEFLLDVAANSAELVRGVVGWADLASPDAVDTIARLARNPLLKSIRPMLHDIADPDWIARADVQAALAALPRLGLRFDALVKSAQLPALLRMVERNPDLDDVIDHGEKPPIASRGWQPWAQQLEALARHPRVHCKLSGLATEAEAAWTAQSLARYVDHLVACFGTQRLLWRRDCPVVDLAGGYARWASATDALLAGVSASDRAAIRGGNAMRFYGLA